jgi:hypothetical protein
MADLIKPKDYTKVGEITVVVFKDGRCPMRSEGLTVSGLLKVLASEILFVAQRDVARQGGADEYLTIKAHCIGINLMARKLAAKESKEEKTPLILTPDAIGGTFGDPS